MEKIRGAKGVDKDFFKNYSFGPFMQLNHGKVEGPSGQALFEAASNYIYVETL